MQRTDSLEKTLMLGKIEGRRRRGRWDPDPLRPALSLCGQATAWECSPGRSLCLNEVVPGTSVFPLSETGVLGDFWGRIKGAKYSFALQDGTWEFSGDAVAGKGLILR